MAEIRSSGVIKTGFCDVCGENHGHAWRGDGLAELPCHPGGKPAQIVRQQQIVAGLLKDGMTLAKIKLLDWYDPRLEPEISAISKLFKPLAIVKTAQEIPATLEVIKDGVNSKDATPIVVSYRLTRNERRAKERAARKGTTDG